MIRAGSRTPSFLVLLAVVATTRQIQTIVLALSWINHLASQKFIVAIHQGSGWLSGSSSIYPAMCGSTHQVSTVLLHKNQRKFVRYFVFFLCPASTVSTECSTGGFIVLALLVRTGRKWSFHCKNKFSVLQLAVVLYTLTQPLIAKIYTPDSAIY